MESVVTGSRSLMDFVEAPLLVGDPDGRVVYVNPSFDQEFGPTAQAAAQSRYTHGVQVFAVQVPGGLAQVLVAGRQEALGDRAHVVARGLQRARRRRVEEGGHLERDLLGGHRPAF